MLWGALMKLDHFVVNIDKKYQNDKETIEYIRNSKFPYEPKWGKGTKGFKVSDLWIGNEYLEMVQILKPNGGGWISEWTNQYIKGHRGMICLMLDVEDIDLLHQNLASKGIPIAAPEWLEYKWCFNLLTRRMPWRNSYLPFFEGVPFQIGFQQMKDQKARDFMNQYMIPNARDNGIDGIYNVIIRGQFTKNDFELITNIFSKAGHKEGDFIKIDLTEKQTIQFVMSEHYQVELFTNTQSGDFVEIENIKIHY